MEADRAEARAQEFGGRAFTNVEALCDAGGFEATYVCLPPFAHGEPERLLAQAQSALFIEKPIAMDEPTASAVAKALDEAGVVVSVGYHFRYMTTTEAARAALAGHCPTLVLGSWIGGMPGVPWWRVRAQSGGQIVEQTTHIFDLARHLVGEVESVHAVATRGAMTDVEGYDIDDASVVSLRFANGAVGTILSSCVSEQSSMVSLRVVTRGLTAHLELGQLTLERPGHTEVLANGNDPYLAEDEAFVAAAGSGDGSGLRSSYADGVATLQVMLAANRSLSEGRPVVLES